jgi:hypothetical protein
MTWRTLYVGLTIRRMVPLPQNWAIKLGRKKDIMSNPFGGGNRYGNAKLHSDVKSPFGLPLTINF